MSRRKERTPKFIGHHLSTGSGDYVVDVAPEGSRGKSTVLIDDIDPPSSTMNHGCQLAGIPWVVCEGR